MNKLIAEIGSVHDGSFGNACRLIDAATDAGAHAVKFQTHIADAESLLDAPSPNYFNAEARVDYFKRTAFSPEQWRKLREHATSRGVLFLSSPFSMEAVDLLEGVGMEVYKIPSGEVTNIPLLERIARTKKPIFLSSGMSNWEELDAAVAVLKSGGPLTIMQCSSIYPCPPERVGLNVIEEMHKRYNVPVGFSDHTTGFAASIAAATMGATVIEKHFTFSRLMYGSDAKHSMEPSEFALLAAALRDVWVMSNNPVDKSDVSSYADMKRIFEKSIVTSRPIKKGMTITLDMLAYKKPGDGLRSGEYIRIVGRKATRDLPQNHKLKKEDVN